MLSFEAKLEKLMDLLESGFMIRTKKCDMWLTPDKHYINWHNYGSSARVKTKENLYWIITAIAESNCLEPFYINEDRSIYGLSPKLTGINL